MNSWENITKEELLDLFFRQSMPDSAIADLFGVKPSQVTYKRRKYDITVRGCLKEEIRSGTAPILAKLNVMAKDRLVNQTDVDTLSKAVTHYIFRNGPVEDIHANGQLFEDDMKILNKFMVNRIAGLLEELRKGNWLKVQLALGYYEMYGSNWDAAEPDTKELDLLYEEELKRL
ncbi:MAG TPA: hypothetical protein PKA19_00785 [Bacillota bacterium]|nr:hypothetical protein [Bacillota bacterium]